MLWLAIATVLNTQNPVLIDIWLMRFDYCPSQCLIAVKRHHGHGHSYGGKHFIEDGLQFRDLVHCHHGKKEVYTQTGVVLEGYPRVLQLDP